MELLRNALTSRLPDTTTLHSLSRAQMPMMRRPASRFKVEPSLGEIVKFVAKPLILPPPSAIQRRQILEELENRIRQQLISSNTDATALQLPSDLEKLFTVVDIRRRWRELTKIWESSLRWCRN